MANIDTTGSETSGNSRPRLVRKPPAAELNAREQSALGNADDASSTSENNSLDDLREEEAESGQTEGNEWDTEMGNKTPVKGFNGFKRFISGKKGSTAVVTLFLSAVMGLMGFAGPSTMFASLCESWNRAKAIAASLRRTEIPSGASAASSVWTAWLT